MPLHPSGELPAYPEWRTRKYTFTQSLVRIALVIAAAMAAFEVAQRLWLRSATFWDLLAQGLVGSGLAAVGAWYVVRRQAMAASLEQDENLRRLVANLPDVTWTSDMMGRTTYISPNVEGIFGFTPQELYERGEELWLPRIHPEDSDRIVRSYRELFESRQPFDVEYRVRCKDGDYIWVHDRALRTYEKRGIKYADGIFSDITKSKRAEQISRENEAKYRSLVSNIPDVVWTADAAFNFRFISPAIERVSGFSREEIYRGGARVFLECIHPDDLERVKPAFEALLTRGEPYDIECRMRRKDGEWIWIHDRAVATYQKDGVRCADGLLSDITEWKRAEEALRESEERLRSLIENTRDWVWETDSRGVYTFASPQVNELLGYEPQEVIGKTPFDLMSSEEAQRVAREFAAIAESRKPFEKLENTNLHKDGHKVVVESSGVPILDAHGNLLGYRGMDSDITERKRAEESRALLASIVESSEDAIIAHTLDGKIVSWNRGAELLTGYRSEEVIGKPASMLIAPERAVEWREKLNTIQRGEAVYPVEGMAVRKDGGRLEVSVSISPIIDASGQVTASAAIVRDITPRKRAEEALRESETRFRQLAENIGEVFYMQDMAADHILYISPAYESVWGRSRQSLQDDPGSWMEAILPEDRERAVILPSEPGAENWKQREYRIMRPDGSVRWIRDHAFPILNERGEVYRVVGTAADITEQKQAEEALRDSEVRFRQLAENIHAVFFVSTPEPVRVIYVSPAYEEIWGRPRQEVYDRPAAWVESIHPEDVEAAVRTFERSQRGSATDIEYRVVRPDGSLRWVRNRTFPVRDDEGKFYRVVGLAEDVTDQKRADEALQRSEQRLAVKDRIAQVFLTRSDDEMFESVLDVTLEVTHSRLGFFGYIDEDGSLVCPSMTGEIWDQCHLSGKSNRFPREMWGGIWGRCLVEKKLHTPMSPVRSLSAISRLQGLWACLSCTQVN
ncbi:MAG TPA: PAS domain S-box protein [Terriglobia bacterium]|nr:PAS domain S-box protein [Terriglobia bacterium]